ncbi:amidohydrolase family protein [Comamonas testosteroni]|uniref:amidohydrolase family protein n=1 Tax=Comamonas testosteroni TaxID=285 RepID=UPI0005B35363|nr:amidohydrolase family protein [Comamonas testosteroni]
MIIDCHGHYTTAPAQLKEYRTRQIAGLELSGTDRYPPLPAISDDQIRESLELNQLKTQRSRGVDMTVFSPMASAMAHHVGTAETSRHWTQVCNDLIHRAVSLYPREFAGACQLPQSPHADLATSVEELERCVTQLGFVACNINPDPSDGHWTGLPLTDRHWYPLYEKMVELDVPGMVHVSCSCNPNFHHTGAHYLNSGTSVFMQLLQSDLFTHFPTLRLVIPHGGGAVPYHWGRYRGLAQQLNRPPVTELLRNVFFDTCVYHQPGIDLLLRVIPEDNVLFASEVHGAVKGIDPETGHNFDDTRRYLEASSEASSLARRKFFEINARRVYPRLDKLLCSQGR